jgi:hypothetical protein
VVVVLVPGGEAASIQGIANLSSILLEEALSDDPVTEFGISGWLDDAPPLINRPV